MKKKVFIGPAPELRALRGALRQKKASFIVLKGRRRVGKSRLVDQFIKGFAHYFLSCVAPCLHGSNKIC